MRFGTFEVDREAGELRKRGLHVKVQEQPFRILTVLLDRLGEMVSREELRRILWPDGTFVDFDHSLNAAIAKLRQALSDSAESPRYIETVARRGYRFIGSVEVVEAPVAHGNGAVSSKGECAMPADGVSPPAQVRASK
jgi:DNA-binding winged helix-turn-helix (wHTH) protein